MSVTKSDLKPGQKHGFLHCPDCDAEYSADSGDYWYLEDEYVFTCECGADMILARRECKLVVLRS